MRTLLAVATLGTPRDVGEKGSYVREQGEAQRNAIARTEASLTFDGVPLEAEIAVDVILIAPAAVEAVASIAGAIRRIPRRIPTTGAAATKTGLLDDAGRALRPPGETVRVERFLDATDPKTFQPNVMQASPEVQARVAEQMRDPAWKAARADSHMRGNTVDSPFVSVLRRVEQGAESEDGWIQTIIYGFDKSTGQPHPRAQRAPHIATFDVPATKLVSPSGDNALSIGETELLFEGVELELYHIATRLNPF
jgi:hypothetical protein